MPERKATIADIRLFLIRHVDGAVSLFTTNGAIRFDNDDRLVMLRVSSQNPVNRIPEDSFKLFMEFAVGKSFTKSEFQVVGHSLYLQKEWA